MKKVLSVLMSIAMLFTVVFGVNVTAMAEDEPLYIESYDKSVLPASIRNIINYINDCGEKVDGNFAVSMSEEVDGGECIAIVSTNGDSVNFTLNAVIDGVMFAKITMNSPTQKDEYVILKAERYSESGENVVAWAVAELDGSFNNSKMSAPYVIMENNYSEDTVELSDTFNAITNIAFDFWGDIIANSGMNLGAVGLSAYCTEHFVEKYTAHSSVAPKCTQTGLETDTCTICGYQKSLVVAATGHIEGKIEVITKAATCTKAGSVTKVTHCAVCNESIASANDTLAATGHTYKNVVTKATLSKNGKITPTCSKCKATKSATTIYYPKTFKLSATSYTYDGKAKKPTVKVTDSKGKTIAASNYTVTYSNNKNVGKATVKITFKGNYSGTKSLTFKINPKATSISSVSAQSKAFTVKWKKQATQTTGYQIQYSTSANFSGAKTVTVSKNGTTSKKIAKLKGKKKYYVRIRTYKTVSGTKYYSAWSGKKAVTTKK